MDRETGEPLGYGFVKFYDVSCAIAAREQINGLRIYNKILKVDYAMPRIPESERPNTLLFKNLPKELTEQKFESILQKYGPLIYARLVHVASHIKTNVLMSSTFSKFEDTGGKYMIYIC